MTRLSVSLLGAIDVRIGDRPASGAAHDKVCALLAYLAVESDRAHRREVLAELLWPDQPDGRGRHSLRQALVTLRQMIGDHDRHPPLLITSRDNIQINAEADYDLDVHQFNAHLRAVAACDCSEDQPCPDCIQRLDQAAQLFRGDFLMGLAVQASPELDNWVFDVRERLRARALTAMQQLGVAHLRNGEYLPTIELARQQINLDQFREGAHRQLMLALYFSGDRPAALAHFDRCQKMLWEEIGVEPEDETIAVRDAIRDDTVPVRRPRGPTVRLPTRSSPFFGRERELEQIAALVSRADCRLVTLTGPGGAGKTRLAVEAVSRAISSFPDGVYFVPLAGVTAHRALVSTIADIVFPAFVEHTDPEASLLGHLRDQEMLIVLDNFEQLVHVSGMVSRMLAGAPRLKIIVTSRQRLDLNEQWTIDLIGLQQPDDTDLDSLLRSDSARLFVESARRAKSTLSLERSDIIAIGRICRLVDGMPLALELAAAWASVLSFAEIAAEIEKSLDFLASSFRDVPDRHRSMRAVFDRSWSLLSKQEREVFTRLSIFRGGFGRQSAEQVAGATLGVLSALVSKSLVYRRDDNRYEVHELLRQYGEAKLWEMGLVHQEAAERHAEYFCALLAEREHSLRGHQQEAALRELAVEIENLRVAWRWAVEHERIDLLAQAVHGLWIFLEVSSRYADADMLFGLAIQRVRDMPPGDEYPTLTNVTLASIIIRHGAVFARLGDNHRGEAQVSEGCEMARSLNAPGTLGLGLNFKGMFALERLDYRNAAICLRESIECFSVAGDRWGEAYSTSDLSVAIFKLGDLNEAEMLHNQAVRIFSEIGDKRGLAFALHNRGVVAGQAGQHAAARQYLHKALGIWQVINHPWAMSMTLTQLGIGARAVGDLAESRQYLLRALQVAHDVQSQPAILSALNEIAANLALSGSRGPAIQLLNAVLSHPASDSAAGARASELLAEFEADVVAMDANSHDNGYIEIEQFSRELLKESAGVSFT